MCGITEKHLTLIKTISVFVRKVIISQVIITNKLIIIIL